MQVPPSNIPPSALSLDLGAYDSQNPLVPQSQMSPSVLGGVVSTHKLLDENEDGHENEFCWMVILVKVSFYERESNITKDNYPEGDRTKRNQ